MRPGSRCTSTFVRPSFPAVRAQAERFAVDEAHHAVDAGIYALIEITVFQVRHDDVADDAFAGDVGQHAFETVADLNPQRAVILGDQEQGAIVHALAAELPLLGHAHRVLLYAFRLGGRHQQHGDLAAFIRARNRLAVLFQLGLFSAQP